MRLKKYLFMAIFFCTSLKLFAEPVGLEIQFKPGDTKKMHISQNYSTNTMGQIMETSTDIRLNLNVIEVVEGVALVDASFENITMYDIYQNCFDHCFIGKHFTMQVNSCGKILNIEGIDALYKNEDLVPYLEGKITLDQFKLMKNSIVHLLTSNNYLIVRPQEVESGDSWTDVQSESGIVMTNVFVVQSIDDRAVRVEIKGSMTSTGEPIPNMPENIVCILEMTGEQTGQITLDKYGSWNSEALIESYTEGVSHTSNELDPDQVMKLHISIKSKLYFSVTD